MKNSTLYRIVNEYATTKDHALTGYGNGFARRGKEYFARLLNTRPEFKAWVKQHYPEAIDK